METFLENRSTSQTRLDVNLRVDGLASRKRHHINMIMLRVKGLDASLFISKLT